MDSKTCKNQEIIDKLASKSQVPIPWCDEFEKMISGMNYSTSNSPEMVAHRFQTIKYIDRLNNFPITGSTTFQSLREGRMNIVRKLLGAFGEGSYIEQGFAVQWGCNLLVGEQCYFNKDCLIFDDAPVTIGNRVLVGPGAIICTSTHNVDPTARADANSHAFPIVIEDNVWIAARVTILPGVRIGKGSLIAAGCVVNKDVPPGVVMGGVPAKILKVVDVDGEERHVENGEVRNEKLIKG